MLQLSAPGARIARPSYICTSCRVAAAQTTRPPQTWATPASYRAYATEDSAESKSSDTSESSTKDRPSQSRRAAKRPRTQTTRASPGTSKKQLKIWQETLDVLKSLQGARDLPGSSSATIKGSSQDEPSPDSASASAPTEEVHKQARSLKEQFRKLEKKPLDKGSNELQVQMLAGALDLLKDVLSSKKSSTPKSKTSSTKLKGKEDQDAASNEEETSSSAKKGSKSRPKKTESKKPEVKRISVKQSTVASSPLRSRFKVEKVNSNHLHLSPIDRAQPPVPRLQYGLDRALFNPGVYHLQDPRSRVYNFDPYLASIMPIHEFDFNALKQYITSSKDNQLISIAAEHKKKYTGSTSSMTSTLAHFHYLLSAWRPINPAHTSRSFEPESYNFTNIMRAPSAAFLHWKDGTYAIDADKEYDSANILSMLGKSMEKLLTLPKDDFEKYRVSKSHELTEEEKNADEAYHYTTLGDFMMRSQLDAYDPRVPGSGMFDLKTRAVVSIRMDARDFQNGLGYEIRSRIGQWESFEREYFDMIRSAFLKYSLQVRMGRMDGIFVAFHNTQRIFGFQYISINEMDLALHGIEDRSLGDREFKLSLHLLNQVLDRATAKYPGRSLRLHIETRPSVDSPFMYIFAKPVTDKEISDIQNANKAEVEAFERDMMGMNNAIESDPEASDEAEETSAEAEEIVEPETEDDEMQSQNVWEKIRLKVEEATENEALGVALVRETIEDALEHSGLLVARSPEESNRYVDALLEAVTSPDTTTVAENIQKSSMEEVEGVEKDSEGAEHSVESAGAVKTEVESPQLESSSTGENLNGTEGSPTEVMEETPTQTLEQTPEREVASTTVEEASETSDLASSKASATKLSLKDLILKLAAQVEVAPQDKKGEAEDEKWVLDSEADSPKNKRFERILSQLMATSKDSSAQTADHTKSSSETVEETTEGKSEAGTNTEATASATEPSTASTNEAEAASESTSPTENDTTAAESSETGAATAAGAPAEDEEEELLGMILTIRNKVNGAYVKRPEHFTKGSSWVVEYAIEDIEPRRASLLYAQIKARRKGHLGPDRKSASSKGAWDRSFVRKLQEFSQRGRRFRRREDASARDRQVHVYGREGEELKWDDVFQESAASDEQREEQLPLRKLPGAADRRVPKSAGKDDAKIWWDNEKVW